MAEAQKSSLQQKRKKEERKERKPFRYVLSSDDALNYLRLVDSCEAMVSRGYRPSPSAFGVGMWVDLLKPFEPLLKEVRPSRAGAISPQYLYMRRLLRQLALADLVIDWPSDTISAIILQRIKAARASLLTSLSAESLRRYRERIKIEETTEEFFLKRSVPSEQQLKAAQRIQSAWHADTGLASLAKLPPLVLEKAALLAAKTTEEERRTIAEEVIDDVSGLVLPPKLAKPYRERGHHENGKRLSVFEHLGQEYSEYLKHHLLFSGHIQTMDRPAYEALVYLANKEAAERKIKKRASHLAEFLWRHGILAGEHLNEPPKGVERQAALIKALQDKRKMIGVSNALASKIEKERV